MKTAILIGGGPSVKAGIEKGLWEQIKGQDVWSVNYAFKVMPYLPSREVFVDIAFFRNNTEDLQKLSEKGVPLYSKQHSNYANLQHAIKQYNCTREKTGYKGRHVFHTNNHLFIGKMGLSGTFAISLAVAEGYEQLYLLGYDFGPTNLHDNFTHFYQNDIKVVSSGVQHPEVYFDQQNKVKADVEDFKIYVGEENLKIWNVSLNSNIPHFPKLSWEEFFKQIKGDGNETNKV